MITLQNITLQRGHKNLIQDLSIVIFARQKIGLVGNNGCGKSSLFSLFQGDVIASEGELSLPERLRIAHLKQEITALDRTALEYVLDGDIELRAIQQALVTAEEQESFEELGTLHAEFADIDGYRAESRAATILHGLGFNNQELQQRVRDFSGGWRMRLNLAQTLMCRSDLLLLDEPTNHLDLDAIIWLEKWLRNYAGTLLLISHDRDFLDKTIEYIFHIEHQVLTNYRGNYSEFEKLRAAKLALQQNMHEKQVRERAHLQKFVDRFRAKASKAKQAQSRVKALEKMEIVAAANVDNPFTFQFRDSGVSPNPLLRLDKVAIGYNNKAVLNDVDIAIGPGQRLGLLGPNGAGKSTLIKLLADTLQPLAGEVQRANKCKVGYFAQHQVEHLELDKSPLQHLQALSTHAREQQLRNFLGTFAFNSEMALSSIEKFSGGEKARLALAIIVWEQPNILLLDEPTNHLDLNMRSALTIALQEYEGAVVVVSHDRYLLRSTVDEFYLVNNGHVAAYTDDLPTYEKWLLTEYSKAEKNPPAAQSSTSSDVNKNTAAAQDTKKTSPVDNKIQRQTQQNIKKLEQKIDKLHSELATIEKQLADNDLYMPENQQQLTQLQTKQSEFKQRLEDAEAKWLTLH